jgi:hypothetical protein
VFCASTNTAEEKSFRSFWGSSSGSSGCGFSALGGAAPGPRMSSRLKPELPELPSPHI